jgi:preprotein translocase subunit YajC
MFISTAIAQDGAGGGGDLLVSLLPLILIFVVFYLLLIRPQQKRMKEHREMLAAVRRGDRVVTGGGIIGQVVKAGDDELTVEIGEGVRVKVLRSTISSVLSKPEPARGGGRGTRAEKKEPEPAEEAEEPAAAAEAEEPPRRGRFSLRK